MKNATFAFHTTNLPGKITDDIEEQKVCVTRFSTDQRLQILKEKLTFLSNWLSKRLSK